MVLALIGGALIGLSASIVLLLFGRVAGISGILGAALRNDEPDRTFPFAFLGGLIFAGWLFAVMRPELFTVGVSRSGIALIFAGVLVGFGARLGGGCTSGHGVCGISRLSLRSVAGTLTFMATGALSVYVVQHLLGGR